MVILMKKEICDLLKITEGIQDWEIIQQTGGKADIKFSGVFEEDFNDDTEQILQFEQSKIYFRIINEEDGAAVTAPIPINVSDNQWDVNICDVPCGGPYMTEIVMIDPNTCVEYPVRGERRRHFCVGDVYLIAGQSNAAGMGKGVINEPCEMGIHVLRSLEYWDIASQPFNDYDYSKYGMFMAFAKKIKKYTGIPIGLIPAAMGGASISRWLDDENGDLYNKMYLATVKKGINIKGVLWYQGCSDAGNGESVNGYLKRFNKFVSQIRRDFKNEQIPVFTFQLNRQKRISISAELDEHYDNIREAQRRAAKNIEKVYVLPAIDATIMTDFIHSSKASNIMLGERLAMCVLEKIYGAGTGANAPEICTAVQVGTRCIELSFKNVTSYLNAFNARPSEFPIVIEDDKGIVEITDYKISSNIVEVFTTRDFEGEVFVSGQCGTDPNNIISDFGTQIPMLCFKRYSVKKGGR